MIAAIVPTLNEEQAIGDVLDAIPDEIQGHRVEMYVIDGGSTDDTRSIAQRQGASVIKQRYPGGKGAAVREGFDSIDADVYVLLDGDGTYMPSEMREVVQPILDDEADHVMGSRMEKREPRSIPFFNLAGNTVFNFVVRMLYDRDVTDMLTGYRALSAEAVESMEILAKGFGVETEMTLLTLDSDYRMMEVPITYCKRKGTSKLRPVRDGARIMKTIVMMARDTRPMLFFSLISGIFLLAASYPTYVVVEEKLTTGLVQHTTPAVVATLLYLVAVQTFLSGLLADQQKNTRKRIERKLE